MNMNEIIKKIREAQYTYIGIRHLADDEHYKVGDLCRNSFDWDAENDITTYGSDDPAELDGTCAIDTRIDTIWDSSEEIRDKLMNAISESSMYPGQMAVIASNRASYGSDNDEIIIKNAEIIYLEA